MIRPTTAAEAIAQEYKVPSSFDEHTEIYNIDGYAVAQDLGFDLKDWGAKQMQYFWDNGKWGELNELEIRLMLFYIGRWLHFSGVTYDEMDKEKDSLLRMLAGMKGVEYKSKF
jgi:hypothetical protein